MKAALLSAFVFPGVGHFFLKKHIRGAILAGASFASLYLVISKTVEWSLQIADKIQRGDVPLDVTAITEIVLQQSTGSQAQLFNIATTVFTISWLIGIIDSYRVGCLQDKATL